MIAPGGDQLNIANGIREFARATPAATAVIDGDRTLTYAALDERASRLANALLSRGLKPGLPVAMLSGNRLEYAEVSCGLAKAGLPMVPVNPRLTAPEVEYICGHSDAQALIADDALAGLAPGFDVTLAFGDGYERALDDAKPDDPCIEVGENEPFCIAYTSGTTGKPKGVLISHRSRSLTFYGTALEWGLGPGRRTIAVAPMYHGAGFAFAYAALHTGGTLSMLRAFDPEALLDMIARDRAQSVFLVPTHAQLMRALDVSRFDTSSLETLYFNAAPLPQQLKEWVLDAFPHTGVHELYGSTEAGIVTDLRPADIRRKVNCVGPAWFMTKLRVVDPDGNPSDTGELYSKSPYLMNGYLDDPEATEACTTPDGYLSSGDIVRLDEEGYVHIIDRTKDLIISGGVNVYPREVEDVLRTHTSVADVAVVGAPSEAWGEEVRAFVVASGPLSPEELDAHCRSVLAGFKLPKRYHMVDVLPRNAAGKVLKTELREQLA